LGATEAVAAGAILAMIADTMIPEAFEVAHDYAGLITVADETIKYRTTPDWARRGSPAGAAPTWWSMSPARSASP
jgi:hypothetical protein